MGKSIGLVLVGALVAGGLMFALKRPGQSGKTDVVVTVDHIKEVAKLATTEYYISTFVEETKAKQWYEWKKAKYIVFLKGVVTGSVDLKQVDLDVDSEGKRVVITFKKGAVSITDPQIGVDDIRFITVSNPNVFNPISDSDWKKGHDDAVKELKQAAMKAGIVAKTKAEAQTVLTAFLGALGYDCTVKFEEAKPKT